MKQVERYFYPAIFIYEPGKEIAIDLPDLKCATSGMDDDDALLSARELLGCVLKGLEEDGEEIPAPTPLSEIKTKENERAVLIEIIRRLMPQKAHADIADPSNDDKRVKAFERLDAARTEIRRYLPEGIDPDKGSEEARAERYGDIDRCGYDH